MSTLNKEIDTSTLVVHFGTGITSEEGHIDDTVSMLAAQTTYLYSMEATYAQEHEDLITDIEKLEAAINAKRQRIKDVRFLKQEAYKARHRINTIIHELKD